jgi:hypothetical protein
MNATSASDHFNLSTSLVYQCGSFQSALTCPDHYDTLVFESLNVPLIGGVTHEFRR